jgi:hypothetical protein
MKIDELNFGSIVIDGKKRRYDVIIFPSGEIKRRKGGLLMFGSHAIKKKEFEDLSVLGAEKIVVGTGTDGAAHVEERAKEFAMEKGIELIELPSKIAIEKFNELYGKEKLGAIIHVTC